MANVYYSVSPYGTGDIKTGTPTCTISSGVMTISTAQTGNIGQGCRITYDTSKVCYISQVNSSTSFNVITATGGTPSDEGSSVDVNSIAHEYASMQDAETGFTDADHINTTSINSFAGIVYIPCYYDHDDNTLETNRLIVSGFISNDDYYIEFYTPTGGTQSINNQRHPGKASGTRFIMQLSTAVPSILLSETARVIGIE